MDRTFKLSEKRKEGGAVGLVTFRGRIIPFFAVPEEDSQTHPRSVPQVLSWPIRNNNWCLAI
jgi:hypothetical protein